MEDFNEHLELFEDEEEIDLIKLVSTDANDANQYLLFISPENRYYAMNVSKIKEVVVYKDLNIIRNYDDSYVIGTADVRGELLTLVNFDKWIGAKVYEDSKYEFVIILNYGGHKFGLVVGTVEYIVTIEPFQMQGSSSGDTKSAFMAKIHHGGKDILCTIVDSDQMTIDSFGSGGSSSMNVDGITADVTSKKSVFFADDSKIVRKLFSKVCIRLGVNHHIFENGKELLDAVTSSDIDTIGLIVTDIEMPVKSGQDVIREIRSNNDYDDIKIVVHTNMANNIMEKELLDTGADAIVGKIDTIALANAISDNIR